MFTPYEHHEVWFFWFCVVQLRVSRIYHRELRAVLVLARTGRGRRQAYQARLIDTTILRRQVKNQSVGLFLTRVLGDYLNDAMMGMFPEILDSTKRPY